MKHAVLKLVILLLVSVELLACNRDQGTRKEAITGKSHEIVIVIGMEIWKGEIGALMRDVLTQPIPTLPENEPVFSLIDVPPDAFINLLKSHRNIITVKISSTFTEPKVEFTHNTWADPQAVINIQAFSAENFKVLFRANSEKIMAYFLKAEKDRLIKAYRDSHDKSVYNALDKELGVKLYVPSGFKVVKKDSSFAWIKYDTPVITQNILVYIEPNPSDSSFALNHRLRKRNLITKKYIHGSPPSSYMTREMILPRNFNSLSFNGNDACEIRGCWKTENVLMGGPFISLSVMEPNTKRVVTVEGNVYAPKKSKEEYIRQLEAMVYSLEFADSSTKNNSNLNK